MKKPRLLNAAIWAGVGITTIVLVCYQWHQQGCGRESLIAAIVEYSAITICLGGVVDATIKDHQQKNQ